MSLSTNHKKVFVIVVTYQGAPWAAKCGRSILDSSMPATLIIVDNGSKDNTVDLFLQANPAAMIIRNNQNLGFGKANNIGIREALRRGADAVFLLNQDAWVERSTLEHLAHAQELHPEFGVMSPLHFNGQGSQLDSGFKNYLLAGINESDLQKMMAAAGTEVYEVDFVNAAAWMVSRQCLEAVGGFGDLFFHYGEDRDYIQRLKYVDGKIGVIGNARVFHDRDDRNAEAYFATQEKMISYHFIGCQVKLVNINRSFVVSVFASWWWMVKDQVYFFFKGKWFSVVVFFVASGKLIRWIPRILRYRKKIKRPSPLLFLEMD